MQFLIKFFLVCEPGWTLFEPTGKCYRLFKDAQKKWTEARSTCQEAGQNGDLASIPNQETNEFIVSFFQLNAWPWIGGYDYNENGVWKWSDGTPWQFENWDVDQPFCLQRREEFCLKSLKKYHLTVDLQSGKWKNEKGTSKTKEFVCQYTAGKGNCPIVHD